MKYPPASAASVPDAEGAFAAHLVALVGSRVCHDLVSPIGAIGNGVELLQMVGMGQERGQGAQEMQLIEDALRSARARINHFRLAFGAADPRQRVSRQEFEGLLAEMCMSGQFRIRLETDCDHARSTLKPVLLAIMCLETAMPWGAYIIIREKGGVWHLSAKAERTKQDFGLWSCLDARSSASANITPAEVHFLLLPLTAKALGRSVQWELDETTASIRF